MVALKAHRDDMQFQRTTMTMNTGTTMIMIMNTATIMGTGMNTATIMIMGMNMGTGTGMKTATMMIMGMNMGTGTGMNTATMMNTATTACTELSVLMKAPPDTDTTRKKTETVQRSLIDIDIRIRMVTMASTITADTKKMASLASTDTPTVRRAHLGRLACRTRVAGAARHLRDRSTERSAQTTVRTDTATIRIMSTEKAIDTTEKRTGSTVTVTVAAAIVLRRSTEEVVTVRRVMPIRPPPSQ
jgi:hypothetical protein